MEVHRNSFYVLFNDDDVCLGQSKPEDLHPPREALCRGQPQALQKGRAPRESGGGYAQHPAPQALLSLLLIPSLPALPTPLLLPPSLSPFLPPFLLVSPFLPQTRTSVSSVRRERLKPHLSDATEGVSFPITSCRPVNENP